MRSQTTVKAGTGWTGSAVTLSSLLSSLTTSPTFQLPCTFIVVRLIQHISSSGNHLWRFSALDENNSIIQVPSFFFHPLHFILSHHLFPVQLRQHCVGSRTDTQTGDTKHWYTLLIPKVYNMCRNSHCWKYIGETSADREDWGWRELSLQSTQGVLNPLRARRKMRGGSYSVCVWMHACAVSVQHTTLNASL